MFLWLINNMKKGFTLIELLIVVAIIGILAGVGIPMYNGYIVKSKITATNQNHKNIVNFIATNLTKCATGTSSIKLQIKSNGPMQDISCNNSTYQFAQDFVHHFDNTGSINPFRADKSTGVKFESSWGEQGQTRIWHKGNYVTIISNIGKEDGFNEFIEASILKE